MGVMEIFDGCSGDFCSLSYRYLVGVMEIFDGCSGDIYSL